MNSYNADQDCLPFQAWLGEHQNGAYNERLGRDLYHLSKDVIEKQKGGKLIITVTITPAGSGAALFTDIDSRITWPKEQNAGLFYLDETPGRSGLSKTDTRQMELPTITRASIQDEAG